jgi:hypothetical protein
MLMEFGGTLYNIIFGSTLEWEILHKILGAGWKHGKVYRKSWK